MRLRTVLNFLLLAATISCSAQTASSVHVDGLRYTLTQAGIQQALTDACAMGNGAGSEVFLPQGISVTVSNTTGQQFLVTCNLRLHGPATQAFWFVISKAVPNTVPLFRVRPSGANRGFAEFDHFRVTSSGGTVGGDVFYLDAENGTVNDVRIHDIDSCCLDPGSWFVNMKRVSGDQYTHGHIWDNNIQGGGVNMSSLGTTDAWLIEHNAFGSVLNGTRPCINATTTAGAAHITAFNNWGSCTGGFFVSHGTTQCKIIYNQIEQDFFPLEEENDAMIDLVGDTYPIDQCEISGNNINAQDNAPINIRLDHATNTIIRGNRIFVKSASGVGIAMTANPVRTYIDDSNEFNNTGGGAVAMTNAAAGNPFTRSFPKPDGTLPATILNGTDGGLQFCTNAAKCWVEVNGGFLFSPKGQGVGLNGATSGSVSFVVPSVAGTNKLTLPAATGTALVTGNGWTPIQTKRVAGCATRAAQFNTCDTTVIWTTAFADTNYTATCSGDGATSGVPDLEGTNISAPKAAASITVRTIALTAAAAQFTTIDCTAVHD